jgi:hypothetical protein
MKVKVYRNLHRGCWSVMDAKTRRVIEHRTDLMLKDATFQVQESGRQRVLRERKKNVHAFISGELVDNVPWDDLCELPASAEVSYNPYRMGSFYKRETGEPIRKAQAVLFEPSAVHAFGAC